MKIANNTSLTATFLALLLLLFLLPAPGAAQHLEPPAPAGINMNGYVEEEPASDLFPPGLATDPNDEQEDGRGANAVRPRAPAETGSSSSSAHAESLRGFAWRAALQQSFYFNSFLQGWRAATEPETRADLGGAFFKEYFRSVRSLRGWDDGDNFLTNYIGHPMQGAVSGRIQIHSDPAGVRQDFGWRREYFKSRLKALGWAALFSINFEIGPLSEASIGNVGMKPREKSRHPMALVDLVVTPTVGTAWLVGEDAIDRFLLQHLERRISHRPLRLAVRILLNPTRSMANIMRFKYPWYRDVRPL